MGANGTRWPPTTVDGAFPPGVDAEDDNLLATCRSIDAPLIRPIQTTAIQILNTFEA